jgi:nucleotide-binding universal stress UspA family protein
VYESILLPTDGSPGSEAAIGHAIHVAKQNDSLVHVVHVIEMTNLGDVTRDPTSGDIDERVQNLFSPIITDATKANVETKTATLEGQPSNTLIEYIEKHDIDLVVMGTHGKSGLSRVLLGSTAEDIVRNSSVPVLTVRVEK